MENNFNPSPEQEKVISGEERIKKVIACAGSGKTTVLTAAIVSILKTGKCLPSEVLALTFTKNAALNMKTRISKELPDFINAEMIDIYTFNSFGNQIIRENSYLFGLSKNFSLLNEAKSWQIVFEIFKKSDFEYLKAGKNIALLTRRILDYIWDIKNNLIDSNSLKKYLLEYETILSGYRSRGLQKEEFQKIDYLREIYDIYTEYERIKSLRNCIDYADQVFMPYRLFNDSVSIREKYTHKYKFIFVDEFQDTNNSQAYLLSKIFNPKINRLMIVGDDDQGIYGFRGASVENIIDMHYFESELLKSTEPYMLTTNFRSGEKIVNFTNNVISNNKKRNVKTIKPEFPDKESEICFLETIDKKEEAFLICEMIKILREKGVRLRDIAILCRKKKFNEIIKVLNKENIRYEFIGNKNLFYENEILFIVSWLKLIYNIYDEESLVYLLKSSRYKISDRDIYFLKNQIRESEKNPGHYKKDKYITQGYFIDSLKSAGKNDFITKDTAERIKSFLGELVYYIRKSEQYNLSGIINLIFHFSGLYDEIKSGFGQNLRKKIKNVESLIRIASDFEQDNSDTDFESFIIYLRELAKTEFEDPDSIEISGDNSIKIMSVHAAKGLEFKIVFLPMLWDKDYKPKLSSKIEFELPAFLRTDSRIWSEKASYSSVASFREELKNKIREEERRIFYVAASRAEKLLIMSHPFFEEYNKDSDEKPIELLEFVKEGINDIDGSLDINQSNYNLKNEESTKISCGGNLNKTKEALNKFEMLIKKIEFYKKNPEKENLKRPALKRKIISSAGFADKENLINLEKQLSEDVSNFSAKNIEMPVTKEETCNLVNQIKPRFFTMTELLTYINCPRLYKLRYLINIPENSDKKSSEFGTKMHKLIADISNNLFKTITVCENGERNYEDYLILLKDYNKEIKQIKNEQLRRCLLNLFEHNVLDFRKTERIFLEELFYWKIGDFFIRCQLDRADLLKNGFLDIYDYKSGEKKNNSSDKYYRNQINFYLIAAAEYFKLPIDKITGYIFYLYSGDTDKNMLNLDSRNEFEIKIMQAISGIISHRFECMSENECNRCGYYSICR